MAQVDSPESVFHNQNLRLQTDGQSESHSHTDIEQFQLRRPPYHNSAASADTIRATTTSPIEIPNSSHIDDNAVAVESASSTRCSEDYIDQFLKQRKSSVTFNQDVRTSTGQRYSILDPPRQQDKNNSSHSRGRSLAQALKEYRSARPHSESDRAHYDPYTGRHLPEFSTSPPEDEPHFGEARFPLLQTTVDALARRRSNTENEQPLSMTTEATLSPVEEAVMTPGDDKRFLTSPINITSSLNRAFSSSYEINRPGSRRKASERWRDGEAMPDFLSHGGSLKKGTRDSNRRSHRDTFSSTKSPRSAASDYLTRFSMSSGGDESAPPAVDGEGATIGDDYVLGKQIGYGGFSIIREVTQISSRTGTQRILAVKIVRKQIAGKTEAENIQAQVEFDHEVDLWRVLNHKHILTLEAVYELKEATFCFIPLNIGGTLFDVMVANRQGLAPNLAASYTYQLASALRYLHLDARVVHRDIKLENCLVDLSRGEPGHLRVCDFGLAEWISNDNSDSNSNHDASSEGSIHSSERPPMRFFGPSDSSSSAFAGGSLEYAAPEILQIATRPSGSSRNDDLPPERSIVSPAVDIWALGVCACAMLIGRRPFQDSFQPRVVMAILAGDWDKVALKEKAGKQAFRVVKACLKMEPSKRPDIIQVLENEWFDEARAKEDGTDGESDNGRADAWKL